MESGLEDLESQFLYRSEMLRIAGNQCHPILGSGCGNERLPYPQPMRKGTLFNINQSPMPNILGEGQDNKAEGR